MRKIQIPEKWQRSESGITVFLNGKSREKIFVRGAIVFPSLDENLGYTGSVCIAGMFESDQNIVIFELEHFSCYDSFLAMLFKRFYDRYGVLEYYFNADADGEFEAKKFMMEKETREYSAKDTVFPELLKLSVGTDYQAFSLLRQKNAQKKFLFKSDLLKDALMGWDESAAFQKAPCELQCVCIAVSGIGSDAWSSFESEKILSAEKMNSGIFEELFDD